MGSSDSKLVKQAKMAENARLVQEFSKDFAKFIHEALIFDDLSRQNLSLHAVIKKFKQECPQYHLFNQSKGQGVHNFVNLVTEVLGDWVMVKAQSSFPPDVYLREGSSCQTGLAYEQCFEKYYEGAVIMHTKWRVTETNLIDV